MRLGLLSAPDEQFVLSDQRMSSSYVPVQSQRSFVFGDAVGGAVGDPEDHAEGYMRGGMIGSQGQGFRRRFLRRDEPSCFIARGQAYREIGLNLRHAGQRVNVAGIEGQGAFEEAVRSGHAFKSDPFVDPSLALKIKVEGVGRRRTLGPSRLDRDQLRVERVGDARNDLVLHLEEIGHRPFEALSPKMVAALRVNELRVDAHAIATPLDAAFERVADVQLAPDLGYVKSLAPKGERGVPRDDE